MTARGLHGILNSATGAADADDVALHAGLGLQVCEGSVDVAGPFFILYAGSFLARELVKTIAAAFAIAAVIERENIDPGGCQLLGEAVPDFALAIALMQKKDPGARLGGRKECSLQLGSVGGGEVNHALGGEGGRYEDERNQDEETEVDTLHGGLRGRTYDRRLARGTQVGAAAQIAAAGQTRASVPTRLCRMNDSAYSYFHLHDAT